VADRLGLKVSSSPTARADSVAGPANVSMIVVSERAERRTIGIAERIGQGDICVTSDIRWPRAAWRRVPGPLRPRQALDDGQYRQRAGRPRMARHLREWAWPGAAGAFQQGRPLAVLSA